MLSLTFTIIHSFFLGVYCALGILVGVDTLESVLAVFNLILLVVHGTIVAGRLNYQ